MVTVHGEVQRLGFTGPSAPVRHVPVQNVRTATVATPTLRSGRIGPNAVLQTLRALVELEGSGVASEVLEASRLPEPSLSSMIPESWFVDLVAAVRARLDEEAARRVLQRSGALTADYVRHHRIPRLAQRALAALPTRVALPMLQRAIGRHAWTFAGAGTFSIEGPYPGLFVLHDAPTCRTEAPSLRGEYYAAAFEGLLRLAAPSLYVREVSCQARGDDACRFALTLS